MVTDTLGGKICLILPHLRYTRLIDRTDVLGVLAIKLWKSPSWALQSQI